MTLALTCALCLAGAPLASSGTGAQGGLYPGFGLELRASDLGGPTPLALQGTTLDLAGGGDDHHGGDGMSWMMLTMVIVMAAVMATVVVATRGGHMWETAPVAGRAALTGAPLVRFATPGG